MKFYIAGKFEEVPIIHQLFERVQKAGHEVAYDWTTHIKAKPYVEHSDLMAKYAGNELQAILASDVFSYLTHERGTTLHMEFGAALAKKQLGGAIQIFVIGEHNDRSPWYFNQLVTRVDTVEEAFARLGVG
jgi:chemotaxis methyl-accepting protein methylase